MSTIEEATLRVFNNLDNLDAVAKQVSDSLGYEEKDWLEMLEESEDPGLQDYLDRQKKYDMAKEK